MEMAHMKTFPVRRLALICLAIALAWIFACSDDTTCPAPKTCPDPAKALPGIWAVFESFVSGAPDQSLIGAMVAFLPHDSLIIAIPGIGSDAFRWVANDSIILMAAMSSSTLYPV